VSTPVGMPRGPRRSLKLVTDRPRLLAPAPHERRAANKRRIDAVTVVLAVASLVWWLWMVIQ
jgi:ferric-dicitrate binding protein FerR (iron transport regulator)